MQFFSMNDVVINDKQHFKVATQNFYMMKIHSLVQKMYQEKTISLVKQERVLLD